MAALMVLNCASVAGLLLTVRTVAKAVALAAMANTNRAANFTGFIIGGRLRCFKSYCINNSIHKLVKSALTPVKDKFSP
jgi:hypothetical protein